MGIPVSGKNLFPSNIQGLPTWYEIRVNKRRLHRARARLRPDGRDERADLCARHSRKCAPAAICCTIPAGRSTQRSAATTSLPRRAAGADVQRALPGAARAHPDEEHRLRRRAGRAARYRHATSSSSCWRRSSPARTALRESNQQGACGSATTTRKNISSARCRSICEQMDANSDKILIDGNTATALGCVYAGATVAAWYPITPATSVMDAFKQFCERYRQRSGDRREQLLHPSGRRRTGRHRHGHRRILEWRARLHLHRRARAFR